VLDGVVVTQVSMLMLTYSALGLASEVLSSNEAGSSEEESGLHFELWI
jgi:hypothetical protein